MHAGEHAVNAGTTTSQDPVRDQGPARGSSTTDGPSSTDGPSTCHGQDPCTGERPAGPPCYTSKRRLDTRIRRGDYNLIWEMI